MENKDTMYEIPLEKKPVPTPSPLPPKPYWYPLVMGWHWLSFGLALLDGLRHPPNYLGVLGWVCIGLAQLVRAAAAPGPKVNMTPGEIYRGYRAGRFVNPGLAVNTLGLLGLALVTYSWFR